MDKNILPGSVQEGLCEYRGHLDAGFFGQQVDYHFDVGASMGNALGDHGMLSSVTLTALAIASGMDESATEGLLCDGVDEADLDDDISATIDGEVGLMAELVRSLLDEDFRAHLRRQIITARTSADEGDEKSGEDE